MTLQKIAYEAYRAHTGGISLASGQPIPEWEKLTPGIKEAWKASTRAIIAAIRYGRCGSDAHNPKDPDYPSRCGICESLFHQLPPTVELMVREYAE